MKNTQKTPFDTRLFSIAITELNISRQKIGMYPKGHPAITKSLDRVLALFSEIFKIKPKFEFAVAKDKLLYDGKVMDERNPVFRDVALRLSDLGLARITMTAGLSKQEIYELHKVISEKADTLTPEAIQSRFAEKSVKHIKLDFVRYDSFIFLEGDTGDKKDKTDLWMLYVQALIDGTLQTEQVVKLVADLPPETFAEMMNTLESSDIQEDTYDKVVSGFVRMVPSISLAGQNLRKLITFIDTLKPEIKERFLTSASQSINKNPEFFDKSFRELDVDEAVRFLSTLNEHDLTVPRSMKNLLDKFTAYDGPLEKAPSIGNQSLIDDILVATDLYELLNEGRTHVFVSSEYQEQIQKIADYDARNVDGSIEDIYEREFTPHSLERHYFGVQMELLSSDLINEDDFHHIVEYLENNADRYLQNGYYAELLQMLKLLENKAAEGFLPEETLKICGRFRSREFLIGIIESLRERTDTDQNDVVALCNYYDESLIPFLIQALIDEQSRDKRRYLLDLISQFGEKIFPEVKKRIDDDAWYVRRNMLFLLRQCSKEDSIHYSRQYCEDPNPKIAYEAMLTLIKHGDPTAVRIIREKLKDSSSEHFMLALNFVRIYKIRDVVPDLLNLMKKPGMNHEQRKIKIPIVRALGAIGDPSAMQIFNRIMKKGSWFFKDDTDRLKLEIVKNLGNFDTRDVRDIIQIGMQSGHPEIRDACLKMAGKAPGNE